MWRISDDRCKPAVAKGRIVGRKVGFADNDAVEPVVGVAVKVFIGI